MQQPIIDRAGHGASLQAEDAACPGLYAYPATLHSLFDGSPRWRRGFYAAALKRFTSPCVRRSDSKSHMLDRGFIVKYHLVVSGELPEPVREFLVEQPEFLIGRGADCDLRLSDTTISRHHCILRTTADELFLVDLGSSNGTYLNGQRVRSQAIVRDGDKVAAGANTFLIRFGAVTPTPTDDPGAPTQRPGTLPRT